MNISAKIVADSTSHLGIRLTTMELEYPRFVHAELMTHRLFSRNSASSRAIPTKRLIEQVRENPAMPVQWGKNQSGMQAGEENDNNISLAMFIEHEHEHPAYERVNVSTDKEKAWRYAAQMAADIAEEFAEAGYHKQIVNRLLEPFQWMKVLVTTTEFDNWFWLRRHPDAQPEIQELANKMWEAMQESSPQTLKPGEWHLPYVDYTHTFGYTIPAGGDYTSGRIDLTLEQAKKVSASCCAQVSYRRNDTSLDKAEKICDKLVDSTPVHASPFEHEATPMGNLMGKTWEYSPIRKRGVDKDEAGVTHRDVNNMAWSANFRGWVQYRQLIPNNTCWNYEEER